MTILTEMFAKDFSLFSSALLLILLISTSCFCPERVFGAWQHPKKMTVICYMNGDNNLAGEVFHAVDMLETVGSTRDIDILALVDGQPGNNGGYGSQWQGTKLLHITKDKEIGVINSPVLEDLGELNLGDPQVLEEFVRKCLKYPSEKYFFFLFAHGRGIIDTQSLDRPKGYKSLLLSPDETDQKSMNHQEFREALVGGLAGKKFDLMLFFSCLTNMVAMNCVTSPNI